MKHRARQHSSNRGRGSLLSLVASCGLHAALAATLALGPVGDQLLPPKSAPAAAVRREPPPVRVQFVPDPAPAWRAPEPPVGNHSPAERGVRSAPSTRPALTRAVKQTSDVRPPHELDRAETREARAARQEAAADARRAETSAAAPRGAPPDRARPPKVQPAPAANDSLADQAAAASRAIPAPTPHARDVAPGTPPEPPAHAADGTVPDPAAALREAIPPPEPPAQAVATSAPEPVTTRREAIAAPEPRTSPAAETRAEAIAPSPEASPPPEPITTPPAPERRPPEPAAQPLAASPLAPATPPDAIPAPAPPADAAARPEPVAPPEPVAEAEAQPQPAPSPPEPARPAAIPPTEPPPQMTAASPPEPPRPAAIPPPEPAEQTAAASPPAPARAGAIPPPDARIQPVADAETKPLVAARPAAAPTPSLAESPGPRSDAELLPAANTQARTPKPPPVEPTQGRADSDGHARGSNQGPPSQWLRYVRAEGTGSAEVDPDARYISDRNLSSPEETRKQANTVRSNGTSDGNDDLARRVAPALQAPAPPEPAPQPAGARKRSAGQPTPAPPPRPDPVAVTLPYAAAGAVDSSSVREPGVTVGPIAAAAAAPAAPTRRRQKKVVPPEETAISTNTTPTPAIPAPKPAPAPEPLRDDFWVPPDPDAPETALLDVATTKAAGWSDLAVLDERVAIGDETRYSTRAHPLGAWMRAVDEQLAARWRYPVTLQALGVRGNVVVQFRVERTGVVSNVAVIVSSGVAELDLAAVQALPKRFEPPPGGRRVPLQYVFRYRQDER